MTFRPTTLRWSLVLLATISAGCQPERPTIVAPTSSPSVASDDCGSFAFTDITTQAGITAVYDNGEDAGSRSIVESIGGGLGVLDFDRDGRWDLITLSGGTITLNGPLTGLPTQLWRQDAQGGFHEVSSQAAVLSPATLTHGIACGDYDNDGFTDILITGFDGLQLLQNLGDGSFRDCTAETGLDADTLWSTSAAWLDIDADGDLDLYVAHYVDWAWNNHPECFAGLPGVRDVCSPNEFNGLPDSLFINDGSGRFRDERRRWGLNQSGKGLGVVAAQLDGDDAVDLYVANDTVENALYLNAPPPLHDQGLIRGVAVDARGVPNGSMGLAVFDFNNDTHFDVWVTNYEDETCGLYEGDGEGGYLWATDRTGVNALGTLFVAFGTVAGDFDLDGDEDLSVVNGHVILNPRKSERRQLPLFLCNTARSATTLSPRFVRQTFPAGSYFATPHRGRGLVAFDLDRDGDLDLASTHVKEPATLLLNDSPPQGRGFTVQLIGRAVNRDAIGTRVTLETDRARYVRQVTGGGSYLSQSPAVVHLAIPTGEQFRRLQVRWPDGTDQQLEEIPDAPFIQVLQPGP
ncbi:MAG: CRTAC1 family protein [Pirellulales bacterium]|nr:CRTAC1 family protein [Pirellulales bacterium]MBL7194603.1 CRTAC1 family protein [Pirellulales bacterium]